ncbi:hypothetical protein ACFX15_024580 [Malus domestica]
MGSYRNGGLGRDPRGTSNGDAGGAPVDKGVDFANYFCTYAFLYHQKEMLSEFDRVRMDAYYNAVFKNKHHFHGKVQHLMSSLLNYSFASKNRKERNFT